MRRLLGGGLVAVVAVGCALVTGPASAPAAGEGQLMVGAGVADASWHVGASAGQYAGDCPALEVPEGAPCTPVSHEDGTFDPTGHTTRRLNSYGIQSRLEARAIVVDGPAPGDGDRFAMVKNDNYIPQDLIFRRAAQLVEQQCPECGINAQNLTMTVTHSHSSPFYSSTSWGAWTFQDVFDVRFYAYQAQQMATALEEAARSVQPAKVGVSSNYFDKTHRHSIGPAIADDGTPAGFPRDQTDHNLTVVRFDSTDGEPIANLVNYSLHGEGNEGNDLISADWVAPLERMLDRETGAMTLYTQGAVGTSEPERSEVHSVHERLEFSHRDYAANEFGARLMADSAEDAWKDVADGTPADPQRFLPFDSSPRVQFADQWYPGPLTHPYPTVSNCRTDSGLAGDPLLPIIGLPDCGDLDDALGNIGIPGPAEAGLQLPDPGLSTDSFQQFDIPVPENYGAPGYTGLEEDIDVHLQAAKIGGLLIPVCSCEQWYDQSRNIELRTDRIAGNETVPGNLGYDWGAQCTPDGNGTYTPQGTGSGTWRCPDPRNPSSQLGPLSDHVVKRMRAQVNNPANGWNDLSTLLLDPEHNPDSEPVDATQIKGNYTHDDSAANAQDGFQLTMPISMANDYNGYVATYREYQRGDHYRKALTGWGPHSSDYMASRLVTMGRRLNDPTSPLPQDQVDESFLAPKVLADVALNEARAQALGTAGGGAIAAYTAALPDDGGIAAPVVEPEDIERFGASFFEWNGGSNFTDNPEVRVQRLVDGEWQDYADQSGEVPVTLKFPQVTDTPAYLLGDQQWHWTAHFEAFVAGTGTQTFNTGDRAPATPAGTYRFTVDGQRRHGNGVVGYHLDSAEFQVAPWSGITVEGEQVDPGGTVSFKVGPRNTYAVGGAPALDDEIGPIDYPDSYDSPARFIRDRRTSYRDPSDPSNPDKVEWFCFTCSFRPWLDSGDAEAAAVRITRVDGCTESVPVTRQGGRWVTARALAPGESAQVLAGGVRDRFGDFNGAASSVVSNGAPAPPGVCTEQPPDLGGGGGGNGGGGGGAGGAGAGSLPGRCATQLRGTRRADALTGTEGGDTILGLGGSDRISSGAGDDCLVGGRGRDRLRGGAGDDTISATDRGRDKVRCGPGDDTARIARGDRTFGCEHVTRIARRR